MKNTKISINLYIKSEDIKPTILTDHINLVPSSTGVKGQKQKGKLPNVPESFWCYTVERIDCFSLDECISDLIKEIWSKREQIIEVVSKYNLKAYFLASATFFDINQRPLFDISSQNIKRMSIFPFDFSLDVYDYCD